MDKDEELGSQDQKNLAEDMKLKRNGTELIGSNGSGLPEKLGKFTTLSGLELVRAGGDTGIYMCW